jgi:hypothetical protein
LALAPETLAHKYKSKFSVNRYAVTLNFSQNMETAFYSAIGFAQALMLVIINDIRYRVHRLEDIVMARKKSGG